MQSVFEKLALSGDNAGVFDGEWRGGGAKIDKISPIDGTKLASVRTASDDDYKRAIVRAQEARRARTDLPDLTRLEPLT